MMRVDKNTLAQDARLILANALALWHLKPTLRSIRSNGWSILNTVLIICMIEAAIYFAFFEPPWLQYKNSPFPVLNDGPLHPGEALRLQVMRCNKDSVTRIYQVAREIHSLDEKMTAIIIPGGEGPSIKPGCLVRESRITSMPSDLPPGRYYVQGYSEVSGYLRTTTIEWRSQPFDVAP